MAIIDSSTTEIDMTDQAVAAIGLGRYTLACPDPECINSHGQMVYYSLHHPGGSTTTVRMRQEDFIALIVHANRWAAEHHPDALMTAIDLVEQQTVNPGD